MYPTTKSRFQNALNQGASDGLEDQAIAQAQAFDPYASVKQSAQGAFGSLKEQLAKQIAELRGQQTGMGRLSTGFATEDEDEAVAGMGDRLNNQIMQSSMQAAGMQQQNNQMLLNAGTQRKDRYLDLLAGQRDADIGSANAKRSSRDSLISAGLGLAANFIPGGSLVKGVAGLAGKLFAGRKK